MKRIFGLILIVELAPAPLAFAQWEPDVRLTYDAAYSYTSNNNAWCVAASGSNVHVVWQDSRDGNYEIYAKRSTDSGVSWGLDTRLTSDPGLSQYPSVAASGSNVHVVWYDTQDGNYEIYAKRSTDSGVSWGLDTRLTSDPDLSQYPSVAASGSNVYVVWEDERDGNYEIYAKRSTDSGLTWGLDTRLTSDLAPSESPSVAASGSYVHVVWRDCRDLNYEIYAKRSTDSGTTWGLDTRLTSDPGGSLSPSVAASGSYVHVVWYDTRDGQGNYEIYAKRSTDSGTTWGLDTRLTSNTARSWYPSVAASGSNVHVVWQDSYDGNDEIYGKRSTDAGTTWGLDTRLTSDPAVSSWPSVAASGSNVHVVWWDTRDGNYEIYYKRNPTGNSGIEEGRGFEGPRVQGIKIMPNPFTSFASLPGYEAEKFSLYDVSGRRVGVFRGGRVGEGLAPGVYFVCKGAACRAPTTAPLRIVKVR